MFLTAVFERPNLYDRRSRDNPRDDTVSYDRQVRQATDSLKAHQSSRFTVWYGCLSHL
jgi:hypothetical protein